MKSIVWNENFSVGVREMDDQHKRLIQLINDLAAATENQEAWVKACADALAGMSEYAATHFAREEELMAAHQYRGLARHQDEHKAFRREIVHRSDAIAAHRAIVPAELLDGLNQYLSDWLRDHILHTDMGYKAFFQSQGVY